MNSELGVFKQSVLKSIVDHDLRFAHKRSKQLNIQLLASTLEKRSEHVASRNV